MIASDAVHWSAPAVLFNTTAGTHHNASSTGTATKAAQLEYTKGYNIGLENEAWILTAGGRLYGAASSWDVFQRRGHGSEHAGPDAFLMRRVELGDTAGSGETTLGQ